jgi:SAM-dependent methyltransferase
MNELAELKLAAPNCVLASDQRFDAHLPHRARLRADQYWTPVSVAARAAELFRSHRARTILDVGCGPGKFCLAAGSAAPELHFEGVEQRVGLVNAARRLARQLNVKNVHFSLANALEISWDRFDGFYFFNPFVENVFSRPTQFDATVELSMLRFAWDLIQVEHLLAGARVGAVIVTYHGLGGPIPSCFELVHTEAAGTDQLRVWLKRRRRTEAWCWVDSEREVTKAVRQDVYDALVQLAR